MYEEQYGIYEIEMEINEITSTVLFIEEKSIIDNSMIKITEIYNNEKHHGISLDKFSSKIVFNILSFEKNRVNTKNEDKLLIGTYFGNIRFNFGSSKLASNILIILNDLLINRISQISKLDFGNKYKTNNLSSDESLSNYCSNNKINENILYSSPELYKKRDSLAVPNKIGFSNSSLYTDGSSEDIYESNESFNYFNEYNNNSHKYNNNNNNNNNNNIFSHYMVIFDLKINSVSFSILNPEDECGFQFEIKKILFHYNNNCYIASTGSSHKKNVIKPNNKIKNQFSFTVKEIDIFYLDTIKYEKKGIVMHHFLKINDILIHLVDVNTTRSLSCLGEISSLDSISYTKSIQSLNLLNNSNSISLNKINFNIKKIRIYYSLDVFFSLLSTANFIIKKLVNPFISSLPKSNSQSIMKESNSNISENSYNDLNYKEVSIEKSNDS
eukprot:jgi/Orpsp1_1/1186950/evm.model.d7180000054329.1